MVTEKKTLSKTPNLAKKSLFLRQKTCKFCRPPFSSFLVTRRGRPSWHTVENRNPVSALRHTYLRYHTFVGNHSFVVFLPKRCQFWCILERFFTDFYFHHLPYTTLPIGTLALYVHFSTFLARQCFLVVCYFRQNKELGTLQCKITLRGYNFCEL